MVTGKEEVRVDRSTVDANASLHLISISIMVISEIYKSSVTKIIVMQK